MAKNPQKAKVFYGFSLTYTYICCIILYVRYYYIIPNKLNTLSRTLTKEETMAQQEKTPLKDEIPDEEFSLTGGAEEQGITISSDLIRGHINTIRI